MKGGCFLGKFNRTFKMLDVAAEKQVQVVEEAITPVPMPGVQELLDPIVTVVFERVILLNNKVIVQGEFNVNKIYKAIGGEVRHLSETIPFSKPVDLPGFSPTVTIGPGHRVIARNTVLNIVSGNQATANGIDVQLYIKTLTPVQILLDPMEIEQKIVMDFLVKISKFDQVTMELPAPARVFEFRNVVDC